MFPSHQVARFGTCLEFRGIQRTAVLPLTSVENDRGRNVIAKGRSERRDVNVLMVMRDHEALTLTID